MNPLDKLRQRTEPAIRAQHQRREVARSTKHYADFDQIRSGYLRTRTEEDPRPLRRTLGPHHVGDRGLRVRDHPR